MSILTNGAFLTINGRRPSTMKSNINCTLASNQYPSELLFSLQQGGQKTNASTSSTLEKSGHNEMDNKTTRHSNWHSNYGGNGIRNKSTIIATGYRTNIEDNGRLAADRAFNTPRSRPRRETADDNDRIEGNQGRNSEIAPSYSEGGGKVIATKNEKVDQSNKTKVQPIQEIKPGSERHKKLRDIRLKYGAGSKEYREVALDIQAQQSAELKQADV